MSRSGVAFPVPLEFGIQEVGLRSHPGLPALVSSLHGSLNWRAEPSYARDTPVWELYKDTGWCEPTTRLTHIVNEIKT